MSLGALIGMLLLCFIGGISGGATAVWKYRNGLDAKAALAQSEANRETERTAARDRATKLDRFTQALEADQAVALAAQRSADGVRRESDRLASRGRAAGASADAAAVGSLAELLAEGTELAREGRGDLEKCWANRDALQAPVTRSEGARGDR